MTQDTYLEDCFYIISTHKCSLYPPSHDNFIAEYKYWKANPLLIKDKELT